MMLQLIAFADVAFHPFFRCVYMPDMSAFPICHCNGIICVTALNGDMVLWNPAMKKFRTIPKPVRVCNDRLMLAVAGIGFGYDSRADDYKVVSIVIEMSRDDGLWLLRTKFCCSVGIVSSDMADDLFRIIQLPDNLSKEEVNIKIAPWNDSVSLLSYPRAERTFNSINAWVMGECSNGVGCSCSWIKKLTIGPLEDPMAEKYCYSRGRKRSSLSRQPLNSLICEEFGICVGGEQTF
ncbi:hypothetical protein TIFTF001_036705 [Ficus carica]|uniref:F-box associated beta-propeller type 1 domain-containing protein n=1 Tax=Ficus carica TaxID=3494 RepID=A0AA88E4T6_FICCA|nr:hypothetical protein TIFTF001_036705 [Ficus carica]